MRYNNGDKYVGEWKDNLRDGEGVFETLDDGIYKGQWKDDKHNGKGKSLFISHRKVD